MPASETCGRFYRWGVPRSPWRGTDISDACLGIHPTRRVQCEDWDTLRTPQDNVDRIVEMMIGLHQRQGHLVWPGVHPLRIKAEHLRTEFTNLAEQWRQDTQHLSVISKSVSHPAYFRIMGMGDAVVPLLLEALRDRPAHWFAALRATANVDPSPINANPAKAREAWLRWGRDSGLID
jgi:hypothetical protein